MPVNQIQLFGGTIEISNIEMTTFHQIEIGF